MVKIIFAVWKAEARVTRATIYHEHKLSQNAVSFDRMLAEKTYTFLVLVYRAWYHEIQRTKKKKQLAKLEQRLHQLEHGDPVAVKKFCFLHFKHLTVMAKLKKKYQSKYIPEMSNEREFKIQSVMMEVLVTHLAL